ncbi:MAG: DUF6491 family protein [Alphaproteobacteria bacterium]
MIRSIVLASAMACVALPALAQPYRDRERQEAPCLRQRNIHDYQVVPGNRSLIVTDISRQRYRLNFIGQCYNLQYQFDLAFRSRGVGTLSCIVPGDEVIKRDPVGPPQCIVKSVEYQTPALDIADQQEADNRRNHRGGR